MAVRAAFARRNGRQRQGQKAKAHRSLAAKNLVAKQREILDLLTPVQYEYLQTQFEEFADEDTKKLPAKKLAPLLRHLGDHVTALETRQLIAMTDADGNGKIDLEELISVLAIRSVHKHSHSEMLTAFRLFDSDGEGSVPVPYFRSSLRDMLPGDVTDDDLEEMIIDGLGGWEVVEQQGLFISHALDEKVAVSGMGADMQGQVDAARRVWRHHQESPPRKGGKAPVGFAPDSKKGPAHTAVEVSKAAGGTQGSPPKAAASGQQQARQDTPGGQGGNQEGFWSYEHLSIEYLQWMDRLLSV